MPATTSPPPAQRRRLAHDRIRMEVDMNPATMTTRDPNLPADYSAGLDRLSLAPLWTALHALLPQERATQAVPYRWRWSEMRGPLLEAARLVPMEQAERRVLVLRNPGLGGAYAATATLFAGLQIILPGETAPSHHHTPAPLRLIVEGRGPFPTVDGVRCAMEPGDLIITPPMRWHDHGHEGTEPVIWLDGLDIPLVRSFEASWGSKMRPAPPPPPATHSSQDGFPPRGVGAQGLRPGESPPAERRTGSGVFHVIEGEGESRIGEETFTWAPGDCVVAPPWHWFQHRNLASSRPAC